VTASDESDLMVNRRADSVQKLASVALCLIAGGLSVYMALNQVWSVATLFLLGLALAAQSYRAVATDDRTVLDGSY